MEEEEVIASRVIETEEQAAALVKELNEPTKLTKEQKLEKVKEYNALMDKMDEIWKSLPRKRKRKIMNKKMKYSARVMSRLKQTQ